MFQRPHASFPKTSINAAAGRGAIQTVYKFKLWNKVEALELLCKHLGLLQPETAQPGAGGPVFLMPEGTKIAIE